jgi:hypothetical protein
MLPHDIPKFTPNLDHMKSDFHELWGTSTEETLHLTNSSEDRSDFVRNKLSPTCTTTVIRMKP